MHLSLPPLLAALLLATLLAILPACDARGAGAAPPVPADSTYGAFLDATAGLTADGLLALHDAGPFRATTPDANADALWRDTVTQKLELTADEQALLSRHGFVVSERLEKRSFGAALLDVYTADLPLFVSADAVLHAFHRSYDDMLRDTELAVLAPTLSDALAALHGAVPGLARTYPEPAMRRPLRDLDVYLTVARSLLDERAPGPAFPESAPEVAEILRLAAAEAPAEVALFAQAPRALDFSQFTVRGHYADRPELERYFRAMMWLGRTELYLSAPQTSGPRPADADVRRQAIVAALTAEAVARSDARAPLDALDGVLALFVGEPDNVTLGGLATLHAAAGVGRADHLLDDATWAAFQRAVAEAPWAGQRIRSQMLWRSPMDPEKTRPASAFLLLGQRFVLDSEVLAAVVYDAIEADGQPVRRMLPDPLDVLFALGNDAAGQLLAPGLREMPYAPNLAAARHLADARGPATSVYAGWLDAIAALAPPPAADRASLPGFMQTAAWGQKTMTTQLAAWAELRHDNLLYAKPSYSVGVACVFPHVYVEPVPAFFGAMARVARRTADGLRPFAEGGGTRRAADHFAAFAATADTLGAVATKELSGVPLDAAERLFLTRALYEQAVGCAVSFDGWYPRLFYGGPDSAFEEDRIVADLHTAPTDASGADVGWVLHAGTGAPTLAVVTADLPGVGLTTFVGPVSSYHQRTTDGFERLTDHAWRTSFVEGDPPPRPDWTRLYLADRAGAARDGGPTLRLD